MQTIQSVSTGFIIVVTTTVPNDMTYVRTNTNVILSIDRCSAQSDVQMRHIWNRIRKKIYKQICQLIGTDRYLASQVRENCDTLQVETIDEMREKILASSSVFGA